MVEGIARQPLPSEGGILITANTGALLVHAEKETPALSTKEGPLDVFGELAVLRERVARGDPRESVPERVFFVHNLLVRFHFIIQMIWWTGLAGFDFICWCFGCTAACDSTRDQTHDLGSQGLRSRVEGCKHE